MKLLTIILACIKVNEEIISLNLFTTFSDKLKWIFLFNC